MEIKVNATRMELLKLKNRLKMAKRGHKLLKDKRDELMKHFLQRVRENKALREELQRVLKAAYAKINAAGAIMGHDEVRAAISAPEAELGVDVQYQHVMNLSVPVLSSKREGNIYPYGFAQTSGELDRALEELDKAVPVMLKLAEVERAVELLADEIEKTRRRVNALEYVLIPELAATVKDITMKLSEMERSNATRLMKIKDIVRAR